MAKTNIQEALKKTIYKLPDNISLAGVRSIINKPFNNTRTSTKQFQLTYYDSFDWRLYREKLLLYRQRHGKQSHLVLESVQDGTNLDAISLVGVPCFSWELPESSLRQKIEPILDMRALMPVAELQSRTNVFKVTDDQKNTVLTVTLRHDIVEQNANSQLEIPTWLILDPIKGFAKAYKQLRKVLESELEIKPVSFDFLSSLLHAQGRTASDYSTKLNIKLDSRAPTDQATRQILKVLYQTMLTNEAGVKSNIDSEFLHDYRVAVRRTRSVLAQLKDVIADSQNKHFTQEFFWLGEITSPVRDLDVHFLQFAAYKDFLDREQYQALQPLKEFLARQRQAQHKKLLLSLKSKRYQKLLYDWEHFLNEDTAPDVKTVKAARPVKETADERIERAYHKVTKQAEGLITSSPPESFHELRKRCKKLRYLLEVFQYLYPQHDIKKLIKRLKILQENLGVFQDLEVQNHSIKQFAQQMWEQNMGNADTYIAIGALTESMERKKRAVRDRYSQSYRQFRKAKITKLLNLNY